MKAKRIVLKILVLVFILSLQSSSSAVSYKRYAMNFAEVYAQRILEAESFLGLEDLMPIDSSSWLNEFDEFAPEGHIRVECAAGTLYVTDSDLQISIFETILFDLMEEDEYARLAKTERAIVAMSALEYDMTQEKLNKILNEKSAYKMMRDTFYDEIATKMDEKFFEKLRAGKTEVIYEGNYTYTVRYLETDGFEVIDLIATY